MSVPTNTDEEWRPIPGWSELYLVSNQGRVFSIRAGIILSPKISMQGYRVVNLKQRPRSVQRNIARYMLLAFSPREDCAELEAAHNDGIKTNDLLANLRWATPAENNADKWRHGTQIHGERCYQSKLTDMAVRVIRRCLQRGLIQARIAELFRTSRQTISKIKLRQQWVHV